MEPHEFVDELQKLKRVAIELQLWKTYRALDEATNVVGWEIAEQKEGNEHERT